jgi:hypothetical protein
VIGYAAHLRIYEPIGALPEPERSRWAAYAESAEVLSRPALMEREHRAAVAAIARPSPRLRLVTADGDGAYLRHLDGLNYVCPSRLQLRAWDAMVDFRAGLPDQIADAFMPPGVAGRAADEAAAWRASHGDVKIGIRSEGWQVPVTWFVLFEPDERRLVLGDRRSAATGPGLDRALVYLTAMSRARRRVARALHVVRRTIEGVATDLLEDLGRWLEEWHPHSLVELDYGGLVHLFDDAGLSGDSSVADVAAALECLANGDPGGAGEHYERVSSRWRAIAAAEQAN